MCSRVLFWLVIWIRVLCGRLGLLISYDVFLMCSLLSLLMIVWCKGKVWLNRLLLCCCNFGVFLMLLVLW